MAQMREDVQFCMSTADAICWDVALQSCCTLCHRRTPGTSSSSAGGAGKADGAVCSSNYILHQIRQCVQRGADTLRQLI